MKPPSFRSRNRSRSIPSSSRSWEITPYDRGPFSNMCRYLLRHFAVVITLVLLLIAGFLHFSQANVYLPANQSKKTISSIVELAPSVADQRELVTEEKSDQSGKQSPNKQDRRIAGDIMKILIHGVAFFVSGFLFGSLPGSSSTRRKNSLQNETSPSVDAIEKAKS